MEEKEDMRSSDADVWLLMGGHVRWDQSAAAAIIAI